jgi:hypothetical protein
VLKKVEKTDLSLSAFPEIQSGVPKRVRMWARLDDWER